MTDTALDCPAIVAAFDSDFILATVQNFLHGRRGWKANMSDEELFTLGWASYEGTNPEGQMTIARGHGDCARWKESNGTLLPCYMGSWFREARKRVS